MRFMRTVISTQATDFEKFPSQEERSGEVRAKSFSNCKIEPRGVIKEEKPQTIYFLGNFEKRTTLLLV
jgi:hypothetical protein